MRPLTTQKVPGNAYFGNFLTHTLMSRSGFLAERTFLSRKDSLLGRERSICKALKVRENFGRQVAPYLDTILVTYSYTYLERTRTTAMPRMAKRERTGPIATTTTPICIAAFDQSICRSLLGGGRFIPCGRSCQLAL